MTRGAGVLGAAVVFAACAVLAPLRASAQSVGDGQEALRTGNYQQAITIFSKVPPSDSAWLDVQRSLARAYETIGQYDDAERVARRATASPGGKALWNTLGEVLLARGRRVEAESAFVRASAEHASDSLTARLNLAVLHYQRGDRAQAMREFDRYIDIYNNALGAGLSSDELVDVATAVEYLGARNPELFKDALKAFDQAIAADPANDDAKVKLGNLFLQKYNDDDAQRTYDEVLEVNPHDPGALLGSAMRREADGQAGADSLLRAALAVNPDDVDARTLHAEMLLGLEDYAGAEKDVERALAVNPAASRALAVAAAIKYLEHDSTAFAAARTRALAADSLDAELYATLGELTADVRLYRQAADFARQGVAIDHQDWHAWTVLGMNQLRLGQIDAGKASLDSAFAGDPYNVWVKNTLDLLDTFKNYDLIASGPFQFMIEKDEAPILSLYMKALFDSAYARFSKAYAYTPPPPIRIEVYRSNADFSVRTIGLTGLGALGVSFGTTLAFDSPAAKDAGPFNWGSTMWHELAHTFTLGVSDHRVPRWLSEGLSVYEEHRARPGWGFGPTPDFLAADKAGKLVPVSRMNDGFMHPAYPEQVQFSYYEASLVCDLIARDFGEPALLRMLLAYKDGLTTAQVFQKVLHTNLADFDKKFDGYLRTRFAGVLASITPAPPKITAEMTDAELADSIARAPTNFGVQLLAGSAFLQRGEPAKAIPPLEAARAMFPEYGGDDSPYALLADAYEKTGDLHKEAETLAAWTSHTETNYKALMRLADVDEKLGDPRGEAGALDAAVYINPFEPALHERLAAAARAAGDKAMVVRERRAVLALGPVDQADAYYQLALAQHEAGDDAGARTSVLRALEQAPDYEQAQTLLLTLYDARARQAGAKKP